MFRLIRAWPFFMDPAKQYAGLHSYAEEDQLKAYAWHKAVKQMRRHVPKSLRPQVNWIHLPPAVGSADPYQKRGYVGWKYTPSALLEDVAESA